MKWYKAIVVVAILYILGKLGTIMPIKAINILKFYYFDVLAPILCIPLFGYLQKVFYLSNKRDVMVIEIAGYIIIFSLIFEYYFPIILHENTSDICDVLCYIGGGIITYLLRIEFSDTGILSE
jgi:hypothetical protein